MADRIDRGPLTTIEALQAARQTASGAVRGTRAGDPSPRREAGESASGHRRSRQGLGLRPGRSHDPRRHGLDESHRDTITLSPRGRGGASVWNPAYIPPKALAGAAPSFAGDQFAFGVAFHEMLTGRRPFARGRGIEAVLTSRRSTRRARRISRASSAGASRRTRARASQAAWLRSSADLDKAIARRGHDRRRLRPARDRRRRRRRGFARRGLAIAAWHAGARRGVSIEEGRAALEAGASATPAVCFSRPATRIPGISSACTNLGALALLGCRPFLGRRDSRGLRRRPSATWTSSSTTTPRRCGEGATLPVRKGRSGARSTLAHGRPPRARRAERS